MNQKELDRIVSEETMTALRNLLGESEEEKQQHTAREVKKLQVEAEDEDTEKPSKKPINPAQTAKDLVDVTLDKVVDKLNMMRSGRSANDKEVKINLDKYFKSLSMGERQSLFVFNRGDTFLHHGGHPHQFKSVFEGVRPIPFSVSMGD